MARRKNLPSISVPIVMASVAVPIAVALLVGWTFVFAQNLAGGGDVAQNLWLLVLGVLAFVALMSVMIMFAIFLGREILEVRRQDSFIDSVTHELRSPLASLKLGLQTLRRPGVSDEKRELLREMMLEDVDRLSAFVDDILQASRLAHDRDKVGMNMTALHLNELLEECAGSVTARHKLPRGALALEVQDDLVVHTDRAALTVVIRNLMDNAVKYSEEPVDVAVRAHRNGEDSLVIEVRDHGIGIPAKDLKRVFNRFYRVPVEGVRNRRGTGLGLFVVSALVRNLGGRVEADSEGPGKGTTVRVKLPSNGATPNAA